MARKSPAETTPVQLQETKAHVNGNGANAEPIAEMIGRSRSVWAPHVLSARSSVDATVTDYEFWDALRRGLKTTYKLAGLFAKPIVQHMTNWTLGGGFSVSAEHDPTTEKLTEFVKDNILLITKWFSESKALGDSYLVVNPDGTLTLVPPDQVAVQTADLDYRVTEKYIITTRLEKATVMDEYRLDGRTVTVRVMDRKIAVQLSAEFTQKDPDTWIAEYPNLRGVLPVIHLACDKGSNEVYGHPVYEAMLQLLADYDDLLSNSITGVKTMSTPRAVLSEVDNPEAELNALTARTETYTDAFGNTQTQREVDLNPNEIIATSGKLTFPAPAPFTADAWQMLKGLFLLMLQHTNIPEWAWGGAVASSKASVEAQAPAFTRFIDWLRTELTPSLVQLMEVYLATVSLFEPVRSDVTIDIDFPDILESWDEVKLKFIEWAESRAGVIRKETALELAQLVDDPAEEAKLAKEEADERKDEFDAALDGEVQKALATPDDETGAMPASADTTAEAA